MLRPKGSVPEDRPSVQWESPPPFLLNHGVLAFEGLGQVGGLYGSVLDQA